MLNGSEKVSPTTEHIFKRGRMKVTRSTGPTQGLSPSSSSDMELSIVLAYYDRVSKGANERRERGLLRFASEQSPYVVEAELDLSTATVTEARLSNGLVVTDKRLSYLIFSSEEEAGNEWSAAVNTIKDVLGETDFKLDVRVAPFQPFPEGEANLLITQSHVSITACHNNGGKQAMSIPVNCVNAFGVSLDGKDAWIESEDTRIALSSTAATMLRFLYSLSCTIQRVGGEVDVYDDSVYCHWREGRYDYIAAELKDQSPVETDESRPNENYNYVALSLLTQECLDNLEGKTHPKPRGKPAKLSSKVSSRPLPSRFKPTAVKAPIGSKIIQDSTASTPQRACGNNADSGGCGGGGGGTSPNKVTHQPLSEDERKYSEDTTKCSGHPLVPISGTRGKSPPSLPQKPTVSPRPKTHGLEKKQAVLPIQPESWAAGRGKKHQPAPGESGQVDMKPSVRTTATDGRLHSPIAPKPKPTGHPTSAELSIKPSQPVNQQELVDRASKKFERLSFGAPVPSPKLPKKEERSAPCKEKEDATRTAYQPLSSDQMLDESLYETLADLADEGSSEAYEDVENSTFYEAVDVDVDDLYDDTLCLGSTTAASVKSTNRSQAIENRPGLNLPSVPQVKAADKPAHGKRSIVKSQSLDTSLKSHSSGNPFTELPKSNMEAYRQAPKVREWHQACTVLERQPPPQRPPRNRPTSVICSSSNDYEFQPYEVLHKGEESPQATQQQRRLPWNPLEALSKAAPPLVGSGQVTAKPKQRPLSMNDYGYLPPLESWKKPRPVSSPELNRKHLDSGRHSPEDCAGSRPSQKARLGISRSVDTPAFLAKLSQPPWLPRPPPKS